MIQNDFEIMVNMPDCSNYKFFFKNNIITKKIRISYINSKEAILFYNLSAELQNKINNFSNPTAIFK